MKLSLKSTQAMFLLLVIAALTGCNLGQAAEPTPTAVDVNAVKTSAAATAFSQLTQIAAQASPTPAPTETLAPTNTAAAPTPEAAVPTAQPVIQITDTPAVMLEVTPTLSILPLATQTSAPLAGAATNTGPLCKNSAFVADVTIPDGTVLKPGEKFTKIWSVQNTGICAWDEGVEEAELQQALERALSRTGEGCAERPIPSLPGSGIFQSANFPSYFARRCAECRRCDNIRPRSAYPAGRWP